MARPSRTDLSRGRTWNLCLEPPLTACRACESPRLYRFLSLGEHPLANGFLTGDQLGSPEPKFPLDIHICLKCGLIQIDDNIPRDFFRHYVYVPSTSDVMREHFAGLARWVAEKLLSTSRSLTVDIGCNDGLFLRELEQRGHRTLGIDPATNIAAIAERSGIEIVNDYFSPELAHDIRDRYGEAAVITTTNTYHHIGDLASFTKGVSILLGDDGFFLIEVPHALEVIEHNQFDGVYHEHVSQFTLQAIVDHGRRYGLHVVDVRPIDVHGGSMRVLLTKAQRGSEQSAAVAEWLADERDHELFSQPTYDAFRLRVEQNREELIQLLSRLRREGRRIAAYGASARGNTLLNYCEIGPSLVEYIADRNDLKHGLYSPGMHIPVVPAERLIEDRPDFVLLLAWNFAHEIMRQQFEYQELGGRFIAPIPKTRVLDGAPEQGEGLRPLKARRGERLT